MAGKTLDEIIALIGDERRAREAIALAEKIKATFEPEVPAFEINEQVGFRNDVDGQFEGKVKRRGLNERGEWEYEVAYTMGTYRRDNFPESELAAVEGVQAR